MAQKVGRTRKPDLRTRTLMTLPNRKAIIDEAANKLTWAEARLKLGPTIHALICDLWESGYGNTGQYLECLSNKEDVQLANGNIKDRMADDKEFLYKLIDHFKRAEDHERSSDCTTYKAAFRHYYLALKLVDEHNINNKYDWLYEEIFKIISKLFNNPTNQPGAANEMIARANFYYSHYLILKNPLSESAVQLLVQAVDLSRGENWCPDIGANFQRRYKPANSAMEVINIELCINLYVLATRKLIELYFDCFEHIYIYDLPKARFLTHEILKLYDRRHGIWTYFYALLTKAKYLIEEKSYEEALLVLKEISPRYFVASKDISILYVRRYLIVGICFRNLKCMSKSHQNFQIALKLARKYNQRNFEAEIFVNIGKLFLEHNEFTNAQTAYHEARKIYESIADYTNCLKVEYLQAKLRANFIFPSFKCLIKYENRPCATFHLRRWKNVAFPFFDYLAEIDDDKNCKSIDCLINELKYEIKPNFEATSKYPRESISKYFQKNNAN